MRCIIYLNIITDISPSPYSSSLSSPPPSSSSKFIQEMEKINDQNPKPTQNSKSHVWDCDSSLYDSFELKSFKLQLESAISSRSLSMPRMSEPEHLQPPPPPLKKSSKISRSLHKLLRSVFRFRPTSNSPPPLNKEEKFYFVYQSSGGVLPTIPEAWEMGLDSVGDSVVRRTASERFTGTNVGISFA
ncbi:uncharacterized protein LOC143889309 [Tasmannia lanceolata]|uniref:uncharacterized protein LOC143889309 n=1 Tax=Tasmannia lanceolata TaxID=3420 RepID=UPI004063ED91